MTGKSVPKAFWWALLINAVWINVSEVFRYFAFVMPMMREAFPAEAGVAPMSLPIFLAWGGWDTVLLLVVTGFGWLFLERFGDTLRNALMAATCLWAAVFVLLWLALYNMNLATSAVIAVALPLAWVEQAVAMLIVRRCRVRANAPSLAVTV
ncbi:hypothetical protein [uncultured Abyssibacter sp.]|uniref:hypothetical protein n=1 Tax=uncultured Abyssibacter sp. TaxID=2320202 RepID=UPI0032B12E60